ncbi:MAG: damage-control phosphatase ARMT1 family protein [Halanaerobiales bacterium]
MKIQLDCIPCISRQVLEAARMITDDEDVIWEIMKKYGEMITQIDKDSKAPLVTARIHNFVKEKTNKNDLYYEFKEKNIEMASKLMPEVEKVIKNADDSLEAALVMSAMGNAIDAGVSLEVDIESNIKSAVDNGFVHSDFEKFKLELQTADELLFIADNAGEAVFDKLLLKELNKRDVDVIYAVRDVPILNDITMREAEELNINKQAEVISSGCQSPGTVLEEASTEFKEIYKRADLVISKGQGNLEGLLGEERDIYFLLKAKCNLVADILEVDVGDFVFIKR